MYDYDYLADQRAAYVDSIRALNRLLDEGFVDTCEEAEDSIRDAIAALEDKLPKIDAALYKAEQEERAAEEREYYAAVY